VPAPAAVRRFVEVEQEVRTVVTVMVTGAARTQEFVLPIPVVSG
jgi:hypothetical protein